MPSVAPKLQTDEAEASRVSATALEVYTTKQAREDDDPEATLKELLDELCDGPAISHLGSDSLPRLFATMRVLTDGVTKKIERLEDEASKGRRRDEDEVSERGYMNSKIQTLTQQNKHLLARTAELEYDVGDLIKMESQFHRMQDKINDLEMKVERKRSKIHQMRPRLYQAEQERDA